MEVKMNKRIKILLSSYIDGECKEPEKIKQMIMEDKEIREIYQGMIRSKEIKKLRYRKNPLPFESLFPERQFTFYPLIITAGAVFIAFLLLFPCIKHIKPMYPNLNNFNIYTLEVIR